MRPVARRTEVVLQEVGPDLVVYDRLRDAAHSLDPIAAHVYRWADGSRTVEDLAADLSRTLDVPDEVGIVMEALHQLERAELLEEGDSPIAQLWRPINRRRAVARMGAAAAMPLVASVMVPEPLFAQSHNASPNPPKPPKPPAKPEPPKPPKPPQPPKGPKTK